MTNSLGLAEYQALARKTDQQKGGEPNFAFPLLGLFGETGSLLSEVKKKQRDPVAYIGYQDSVIEEFGDALWYLAAVSDRANLSLPELAINLDRTISTWESTGPQHCGFRTSRTRPKALLRHHRLPSKERFFSLQRKSGC